MRVSLSPVHNEHTPQHVQVDGNVVWILSRQCADCCHTIPNRVYATAKSRHIVQRFPWHRANVYRRGHEPPDGHCGDGHNERGGVLDFWRWVYVKRSGFAFGWHGDGNDDLRPNEKHSPSRRSRGDASGCFWGSARIWRGLHRHSIQRSQLPQRRPRHLGLRRHPR